MASKTPKIIPDAPTPKAAASTTAAVADTLANTTVLTGAAPKAEVVTDTKSQLPDNGANTIDPAVRDFAVVKVPAPAPAMTNPAMAQALADSLQPAAAITQGVSAVLEPGQETPTTPMVAATVQLVAQAPAPAPETTMPPASESLTDFLYRVQNVKEGAGVVVVEAAHPDAPETIKPTTMHQGTYSGFTLKRASRYVRWSDGTTEGTAPSA